VVTSVNRDHIEVDELATAHLLEGIPGSVNAVFVGDPFGRHFAPLIELSFSGGPQESPEIGRLARNTKSGRADSIRLVCVSDVTANKIHVHDGFPTYLVPPRKRVRRRRGRRWRMGSPGRDEGKILLGGGGDKETRVVGSG